MLRNIAPEIAEAESSTDLNTPLMQLLRLAWGYKEVNDDQLDKVSELIILTTLFIILFYIGLFDFIKLFRFHNCIPVAFFKLL